MSASIQLDESWLAHLSGEFDQPYMLGLRQFLVQEKKQGKAIFPPGSLIFNALNSTPLEKVKVVILGQDPYHGDGQAHGLCFSVLPNVKIPPSLLNIYKEISRDLGLAMPTDGCLQSWADQGVLLLNSVLTVQRGQAASHQGKGWERFTDRVVEVVNGQRENVVFLLWGSYAQKKGSLVDANKHLVLRSTHPSPLSAHRGFLGCGHFSKTNQFLADNGVIPVDWVPTKPGQQTQERQIV